MYIHIRVPLGYLTAPAGQNLPAIFLLLQSVIKLIPALDTLTYHRALQPKDPQAHPAVLYAITQVLLT